MSGEKVGEVYDVVGVGADVRRTREEKLPDNPTFQIGKDTVNPGKIVSTQSECEIKWCDRKKGGKNYTKIKGNSAKCVFREVSYTDNRLREKVNGKELGQLKHYNPKEYEAWLKNQKFEETPNTERLIVNDSRAS